MTEGIFAVLYVSIMGHTRFYKTTVFFTFINQYHRLPVVFICLFRTTCMAVNADKNSCIRTHINLLINRVFWSVFAIVCNVVISTHSAWFAECGGTLTEPSGSIQSVLYPDRYHNNANCTWYITVPDQKVIRLRCSMPSGRLLADIYRCKEQQLVNHATSFFC